MLAFADLATFPVTLSSAMWWKCEVRFFRSVIRLRVWARNEPDARAKVERMYQLATIQNLAPIGSAAIFPVDKELAETTRSLPYWFLSKGSSDVAKQD